jgi:DNA-directed RNA polymerase subunit beta'
MLFRQENKTQLTPDFEAIRISLASPKKFVRGRTAKSPSPKPSITATLKPERDGLFCARISVPYRTGNVCAENTSE